MEPYNYKELLSITADHLLLFSPTSCCKVNNSVQSGAANWCSSCPADCFTSHFFMCRGRCSLSPAHRQVQMKPMKFDSIQTKMTTRLGSREARVSHCNEAAREVLSPVMEKEQLVQCCQYYNTYTSCCQHHDTRSRQHHYTKCYQHYNAR